MTNRRRNPEIPPYSMAFDVDSAQVIAEGDLCIQVTDDVRAADQTTYGASLAAAQANFKADFVGVAMTASASGETDRVTVATRGWFEFNCAAATFEIGDLVGPDDNAGGTALLNDQVIAVAAITEACGRVVKRYSANTTRVVIEIFPFVSALDVP